MAKTAKTEGKVVNFRLPPDQWNQLSREAATRDMTLSQVIREALRDKLRITLSDKQKTGKLRK
jgi:predicted DNA-binding ribbon-helix-helix protein